MEQSLPFVQSPLKFFADCEMAYSTGYDKDFPILSGERSLALAWSRKIFIARAQNY